MTRSTSPSSTCLVVAALATSLSCGNEMQRRLRSPQDGVDVAAIRREAVPLRELDLDTWLAERDVRVLALGEPTHGSANVRRLHVEIMLAAVRRWRSVAIVGEWCEDGGERLDAFVRGEGSAEHVPRAGGPVIWSATWDRGWRALRELNARGADVRVFGMRPCLAREHLVDLRSNEIELEPAVVAAIDAALEADTISAYPSARDAVAAALQRMGTPDDADARRRLGDAWHELELLDQSLMLYELDTNDANMAANLRWLLARHAPDHHAIVLAHDAHVARTRSQLISNGTRVEVDLFGTHVGRWLGRDYRAVTMLVGNGSFCAVSAFRVNSQRTTRFRLRHRRGAIEQRLAEVAGAPWTVSNSALEHDAIPHSAFQLVIGFSWGWPDTWFRRHGYFEADMLRDFDDIVFFPIAEPDDIVGCSRPSGG